MTKKPDYAAPGGGEESVGTDSIGVGDAISNSTGMGWMPAGQALCLVSNQAHPVGYKTLGLFLIFS